MERYGGGGGVEGGGERMVMVAIDGKGMMWWVELGGLVARATRWVRGHMV